MASHIAYVTDEAEFVLSDTTCIKLLDEFGPYCVEQYVLMEALSKHEVAQNVLEYYVRYYL